MVMKRNLLFDNNVNRTFTHYFQVLKYIFAKIIPSKNLSAAVTLHHNRHLQQASHLKIKLIQNNNLVIKF